MASTTMTIRTDTELKSQVEDILDQLGMNISGAVNMFFHQIVRERAVPLNLSLDKPASVYEDLLLAQAERARGITGRSADEVLSDMDRIVSAAEGQRNDG